MSSGALLTKPSPKKWYGTERFRLDISTWRTFNASLLLLDEKFLVFWLHVNFFEMWDIIPTYWNIYNRWHPWQFWIKILSDFWCCVLVYYWDFWGYGRILGKDEACREQPVRLWSDGQPVLWKKTAGNYKCVCGTSDKNVTTLHGESWVRY